MQHLRKYLGFIMILLRQIETLSPPIDWLCRSISAFDGLWGGGCRLGFKVGLLRLVAVLVSLVMFQMSVSPLQAL
jgi:hypothetical protein